MDILVTGSAGFIGSHLVEKLRASGHRVADYDLKTNQDIHEITSTLLLNYDVVIHLAAEPSVQDSIDRPLQTYETNVLGTLNILEACRHYKTKFIFASSSQATENAENPYALQKYQCEQWIELYGKLYNVPYAILRFYNVFGKGGHGVVERFMEDNKNGLTLQVYGGHQRRDFVYVDTVVDKLIEALKFEGTFSVGSGKSYSIQEIADMISPNQVTLPIPDGEPLETLSPVAVPTLAIEEYLV